jgi:putative FmdB family regulatory protein
VPTYQYVCTECGGQLEAVQKFTDDALTVHEDCGGRLRKVYSPVGIVFKGSGFYRTDSRGSGSSSSSTSSNGSGSASTTSDSPASESSKSGGEKSSGDSSSSSSAPAGVASSSSSSGSSGEKVA